MTARTSSTSLAGDMPDWPQPSFEAATAREWIVTNGLGGYASSTICGANTRRYHGLFVPAVQPPTVRRVMVSKIEEMLVFPDQPPVELGTNRYPGVIHPDGFIWQTAFRRMPLPEASFTVGQHVLRKTVWMRHGANVSIVRYQNGGDHLLTLRLLPLLAGRDHHHLQKEQAGLFPTIQQRDESSLHLVLGEHRDSLVVRFTAGTFTPHPDWYRSFVYDKETYRGLDDHEDLMTFGWMEVTLPPGDSMHVIFALTEEDAAGDPEVWMEEEIRRLQRLPPGKSRDAFIRDLCISGDQFLVQRGGHSGHTIIAGYPWFTDWGRDTMIAMRGLVIAQGKKKISRSIFRTYLSWTSQGMIPNRFPDSGEQPEYNTIDATLWMFVALYEHAERFDDIAFAREVLPALEEIVHHHQTGTRFGIRVTPEHLLSGGEDGLQLTWMDARVDGYVVTPRQGCPVEINALWYNALCILASFRSRAGRDDSDLRTLIRKTRKAFRKHFLHPDGHLYDVVDAQGTSDPAIRPNMIYAVSLPFKLLKKKEARRLLEVVSGHLYTDLGLRSLSPDDPAFQPVYGGDVWARDLAYHQGTVWAYLWGEYALAYLRVHDFSVQACRHIHQHTQALEDHFYHADGLHAISEIFDGLAPGPGRGCFQQAWSIGMLLRVLLDEQFKPGS